MRPTFASLFGTLALTAVVSTIVLNAQIPGVWDPVGDEVKKRTGIKKVEDEVKRNDPTGLSRKASETVEPAVKQVAGGTETTVKNFAGGTLKTIETAGGQAVKNIVNAGNAVVITYEKTWKNVGDQVPRTLKDTADAVQAVVRFGRNQLESEPVALNRARNRLEEGKPIDAVWGDAVERAQTAEQNFGKATRESRVINAAASTAAAAYGGPAGAAAYAAWSTYRSTGNANDALKAGMLAAITYEAGSVANMPSGTAGELLQKAAFTGAVGGIAVAAAGGTEADVRDAFLRSAGAILVQKGTDQLKAYSPQAGHAIEAVQCVSTMDVDCFSDMTYVRDTKRKIVILAGQPKIERIVLKEVGRWTGTNFDTPAGKRLKQVLKISKLPNSEVIPLLDNQWVLTWTLGRDKTIKRNQPTVVLTYVGPNPPFTSTVSYNSTPRPRASSAAFAKPGGTGGSQKSYSCSINGSNRTITKRVDANGCHVAYHTDRGTTNVWESRTEVEKCDSRVADFMSKLAAKGISCHAD